MTTKNPKLSRPTCGDNRGWFQRLVSWLTRGFPMQRQEYLLYDRVANKPVHRYVCGNGKEWMATGRWDLMRVEFEEPANIRS